MQYRVAKELLCMLELLKPMMQEQDIEGLHHMAERFRCVVSTDELQRRSADVASLVPMILKVQEIADRLEEAPSVQEAGSALQSLWEGLKREAKPVKVAFFVQEFSLWPSFQTVWEACGDEIDKSIVFVYTLGNPLSQQETNQFIRPYQEAGYPVLTMAEYDVEAESPDLVFYMKPYYGFRGCPDGYYINDVKKHTPYTVFISYCLDVQGGEELQRYFYGLPFFYHVWRVIGYSRYYKSKMIERGFRNGENVVTLGHPKFDIAYSLSREKKEIHGDWEEKIRGRKVVLWNTHFTVEAGKGVGTYFQWKDIVFEYFNRHSDLVLLWRPHPLFWESVVKVPGVDPDGFSTFIEALEERDNIIVDRTGDYRYAFCMSDALISDAATFLVEYSASGNPVLYTVKEDGEKVCNDDYLVGMKVARQERDMTAFLEGIRTNQFQDNAEERLVQFEKIFGKSDGMVGTRIWEYLFAEVNRDIHGRAQRRLRALTLEDGYGVE